MFWERKNDEGENIIYLQKGGFKYDDGGMHRTFGVAADI